jgi:hypothetical protein
MMDEAGVTVEAEEKEAPQLFEAESGEQSVDFWKLVKVLVNDHSGMGIAPRQKRDARFASDLF